MKKELKKPKHFRLIIEIIVIVGIVITVLAFRFIPWFLSQPVEAPDPYADYQRLFNDVAGYDYAGGPNTALEKRIDRAVSNENANSTQAYYNLKAKGEYYRRTGRFSVAIQALEEALTMQVPLPDEYEYIYTSLLECYRGIGDYTQASKYQSILDGTYRDEASDTQNTSDADNVEGTDSTEEINETEADATDNNDTTGN